MRLPLDGSLDGSLVIRDCTFGLFIDLRGKLPANCKNIVVTYVGEEGEILNVESLLPHQLYIEKIINIAKKSSDGKIHELIVEPKFDTINLLSKCAGLDLDLGL